MPANGRWDLIRRLKVKVANGKGKGEVQHIRGHESPEGQYMYRSTLT